MTRVFFFNDTATTEIYTLSLHDALPICLRVRLLHRGGRQAGPGRDHAAPHDRGGRVARHVLPLPHELREPDRKSTRLNSSHANIVCRLLLEKKNHTCSAP